MSCLKMRTCCFCMDTAKGSIATAIACMAACAVTFIFLVLSLVYWEEFSGAVYKYYEEQIGLGKDSIEFCLSVIWYGNIFTMIIVVIYVILSYLVILGVSREQFKHMIPWISITSLVLPFFIISFIVQLIFGLVGLVLGVIIPAILVLIWLAIWSYGFFCVVSHYRVLKGDIHRPVTAIYNKR